jgi:hypothetical protein
MMETLLLSRADVERLLTPEVCIVVVGAIAVSMVHLAPRAARLADCAN